MLVYMTFWCTTPPPPPTQRVVKRRLCLFRAARRQRNLLLSSGGGGRGDRQQWGAVGYQLLLRKLWASRLTDSYSTVPVCTIYLLYLLDPARTRVILFSEKYWLILGLNNWWIPPLILCLTGATVKHVIRKNCKLTKLSLHTLLFYYFFLSLNL
jgi:hypothetical protein